MAAENVPELREADQRGRDAALVLENPAYIAAMARMREEIITEWKSCPVRDKEGQLLLLQLAKLADKFEGTLAGMVNGGKYARTKLAQLDEVRDENAARRFMRRVL